MLAAFISVVFDFQDTASNTELLLYAANGEPVNLTCTINTDEIDWYFMNSNSTTKQISTGTRVQILKHVHTALPKKLTKTNKFLKYRVNSDHNLNHILTVHVEGKEDEGVYQCIDSKSEKPVKRMIKLLLSKIFVEVKYLRKLKKKKMFFFFPKKITLWSS